MFFVLYIGAPPTIGLSFICAETAEIPMIVKIAASVSRKNVFIISSTVLIEFQEMFSLVKTVSTVRRLQMQRNYLVLEIMRTAWLSFLAPLGSLWLNTVLVSPRSPK